MHHYEDYRIYSDEKMFNQVTCIGCGATIFLASWIDHNCWDRPLHVDESAEHIVNG